MQLPPHVVRLAEPQLGVVARWQLVELLSDGEADRLLRHGWFEQLHRGVYRVRGGARLAEQAAIGATLRCGPDASLSGPVALRLLEVDGIRAEDPFLVLLPPGRRVTGLEASTVRDPDPGRPVARWGQVRVAGPVDALIDSARFVEQLGERRLRLAHDVLRWRGLITPGRLSARVNELGVREPHSAGLQMLLGFDATPAAGDGERRLGQLLSRFDPPPEAQVWVTPRRRVDWYFRALRYGYEYQGSVDHGTVGGRAADDARDRELRREGIRLGYVTAADLGDEAALLATVAGSLGLRAHELGIDGPILRAG